MRSFKKKFWIEKENFAGLQFVAWLIPYKFVKHDRRGLVIIRQQQDQCGGRKYIPLHEKILCMR